MDSLKSISVITAVMTTTAVIAYFIWQFILGLPTLKSVAGVVLTIVIILCEIISVWWVFSRVRVQYKENIMESRRLPQAVSLPSPEGTTTRRARKPKYSILIALTSLIFTGIFASTNSMFSHQNQQQIMDSSYLQVYGNPTLSDQLQQPGQWQERSRDFSDSHCQFIGGSYHVSQAQLRTMFTCPSTSTFKNFAFEAEMMIIQGDCGGVNVREDLVFAVCQGGTYTFTTQKDLQSALDPSPGIATSTINRGINQHNLIAIIAQDTSITLFINHQKIQDTHVNSTVEASINFIALSVENSTAVTYNNAKIWSL